MNKVNTALHKLETLYAEQTRKKYKSIPDHALPKKKFSDKTANLLTNAVIVWLRVHAHSAWRQSSEGRYRPGKQIADVLGRVRQMKGVYLPGTNKGHGDVSAIIHGQFVTWEVKMKDSQSDVQSEFQKEIEASGGRYFICRRFDEFVTQYETVLNQIKNKV